MTDTTDNTTSVPATPLTPAQPVNPPVDATMGVPAVTPFPAWVWTTPVIPQFYWNVYSAEQRIRQICVEIGKIQAYLAYFADNANAAHWYIDNRFTQVETRLTARVDKLESDLTTEVTRLDKLIADETTNRVNGDNALQTQLNETAANLTAEIQARKDGDKTNADAITAETTARTDADNALNSRIDTETTDRKAADTTLTNAINAETSARDQAVQNEATARATGDKTNADAISAETKAREQAITDEAAARTSGDKTNADAISAETKARTTADNDITIALNHRPRANAITAKEGSHITVTSTEGDGTEASQATVVIGDTFDADFEALRTAISDETTERTNADTALETKLESEIDERRHDDEVQNDKINGKLSLGAVLPGDGITVTNDPDKTTATVGLATHPISEGMLLPGTGVKITRDNSTKALTVTATGTDYTLPTASTSTLGGVKIGSGLAITEDGTLSTTGGGSAEFTGVTTDGSSLTGTGANENDPLGVATAPNGGLSVNATTGSKGLQINAGDGLQIQNNAIALKYYEGRSDTTAGISLKTDGTPCVNLGAGLRNASDAGHDVIALSTPSADSLGGIKIGDGITVADDGTASVRVGNGLTFDDNKNVALAAHPISEGMLLPGTGVKITRDSSTKALTVTATGTDYTLPTASANTLGGVKVGSGITVTSDGTISRDITVEYHHVVLTPNDEFNLTGTIKAGETNTFAINITSDASVIPIDVTVLLTKAMLLASIQQISIENNIYTINMTVYNHTSADIDIQSTISYLQYVTIK